MKVSTDLLKAIAVGVALGTTTTSCDVMFASAADLVEEGVQTQQRIDDARCGNSPVLNILGRNTAVHTDNCPACGMG